MAGGKCALNRVAIVEVKMERFVFLSQKDGDRAAWAPCVTLGLDSLCVVETYWS